MDYNIGTALHYAAKGTGVTTIVKPRSDTDPRIPAHEVITPSAKDGALRGGVGLNQPLGAMLASAASSDDVEACYSACPVDATPKAAPKAPRAQTTPGPCPGDGCRLRQHVKCPRGLCARCCRRVVTEPSCPVHKTRKQRQQAKARALHAATRKSTHVDNAGTADATGVSQLVDGDNGGASAGAGAGAGAGGGASAGAGEGVGAGSAGGASSTSDVAAEGAGSSDKRAQHAAVGADTPPTSGARYAGAGGRDDATARAFAAESAGVTRIVSAARVLLLGMGADEQMAGYGRHRTKFRHGSWQGLHDELVMDVHRIWTRNLGRDDRCCADLGKETRLPFLDDGVVNYLARVPMPVLCDLRRPLGAGDKRILRSAAKLLGLGDSTQLVKRAIHFGSRIAKQTNVRVYGSNRGASGDATFPS